MQIPFHLWAQSYYNFTWSENRFHSCGRAVRAELWLLRSAKKRKVARCPVVRPFGAPGCLHYQLGDARTPQGGPGEAPCNVDQRVSFEEQVSALERSSSARRGSTRQFQHRPSWQLDAPRQGASYGVRLDRRRPPDHARQAQAHACGRPAPRRFRAGHADAHSFELAEAARAARELHGRHRRDPAPRAPPPGRLPAGSEPIMALSGSAALKAVFKARSRLGEAADAAGLRLPIKGHGWAAPGARARGL